mmetsp:Transcript_8814/g.20220  ORF Transcript_8814/g.20220 Transcript_8814/m.20220 type:complete len:203 (-) Transcript_8814:84-692(-)
MTSLLPSRAGTTCIWTGVGSLHAPPSMFRRTASRHRPNDDDAGPPAVSRHQDGAAMPSKLVMGSGTDPSGSDRLSAERRMPTRRRKDATSSRLILASFDAGWSFRGRFLPGVGRDSLSSDGSDRAASPSLPPPSDRAASPPSSSSSRRRDARAAVAARRWLPATSLAVGRLFFRLDLSIRAELESMLNRSSMAADGGRGQGG